MFGTAFASFSTDSHQTHLSRRPLESSVKVGHTSPCASGEVVKDVHNSYFRQYDQWNVCFHMPAVLDGAMPWWSSTRSSPCLHDEQDGWPPLRWDPTLSPGGAFSRGGKHSDVGPLDGFAAWCGMYLLFQSHKEFKNHSTSILAPACTSHFDPFWLWGCDAWSSRGSSSGSRWCCMAHLCRWFSKILSAGPISEAPTCTAVASFTFIVAAIFVSEVNKWKWFPKQRRWMNLPSEASDDWFLRIECCTYFFVASWNVWVLIGKMQCNTVHSIILNNQTLLDMTLPRDDRCVTTISWIVAVKSCVRHSSSRRTVGNPKPSSPSLFCPPKTLAKSCKDSSGFIRVSVNQLIWNKNDETFRVGLDASAFWSRRSDLSWRTLHSYMYVWTPRELCNRCLSPTNGESISTGAEMVKMDHLEMADMIWWLIWCW